MTVGAAFGVGGVAFALLIAKADPLPRASERLIRGAFICGGLGAIASIGLQGLDLHGAPLEQITNAGTWRSGLFATGFGFMAVTALLSFALAAIARRASREAVARSLAICALALVGVAFASTGHAATASPQLLTRPTVFLHAVAVVFWIGSLPPLAMLARTRGSALARPLQRFSDAIPFALVAVFASGLALAIVQLGSVEALWRTEYGLVLGVKLGLLLAILCLALANRVVFAPHVQADIDHTRRLARSIMAETVLALGVLGVVGLWRFTPPPRSASGSERTLEAASVWISEGDFSGRLTARPPKAGMVSVTIDQLQWRNSKFQPLALSFTLEKPSFGLGPFTKDATRAMNGEFSPAPFYLPMDGFWIVRVDVLVSDFQKVSATEIISLRP
ncbi:copper resistance D family protein [Terrarubrum flagellatum]|uniref:copper resistance D family protein n=1 Tax=Terrirubrum flagellatum TaxID=2895980 RepID=UPI00314549EA